MKPFEKLTYRGQLRRLRRLAQAALDGYGLGGSTLKLIGHGENTTFRVVAASAATAADNPFVGHHYLLRVHRPGYQTAASIRSELAWLAALRQRGQVVPEPVPSPTGDLLTEVAVPGMPEARCCALFHWMRGRKISRIRLQHFATLGRLMAQLHGHAMHWSLPPGFTRRRWDWDGLFGDDAGFNLAAAEVWALLPEPYAGRFRAVADRTRQVMGKLGQEPDAFGLIHADLFLGEEGNVLFSGGEARPIDFDDCGFGYWVYDLAVSLAHWQRAENWPRVRDALLDGYNQVRPFPAGQLAHLDLFMAARHVSEILWATDMAQVNPRLRTELPGWRVWADSHVQQFLGGGEYATN
jgi:Ser/Thr protein kinase RdoA (MazF antagonist)